MEIGVKGRGNVVSAVMHDAELDFGSLAPHAVEFQRFWTYEVTAILITLQYIPKFCRLFAVPKDRKAMLLYLQIRSRVLMKSWAIRLEAGAFEFKHFENSTAWINISILFLHQFQVFAQTTAAIFQKIEETLHFSSLFLPNCLSSDFMMMQI